MKEVIKRVPHSHLTLIKHPPCQGVQERKKYYGITDSNFAECSAVTSLNRQTGKLSFTLIELLLVIAIIAILMAILLPTLSSAKKLATRSCCLSQLKQLGSLTFSYSDDFNGWLPPLRDDLLEWPFLFAADGKEKGFLRISMYVKGHSIFYCPNRHENWNPGCNWDGAIISYLWLSGPNGPIGWGYLPPCPYSPDNLPYKKQRLNEKTPDTPLMADSVSAGLGYFTNHENNYKWEGGNILYSDGSAKWKKVTDMAMKSAFFYW